MLTCREPIGPCKYATRTVKIAQCGCRPGAVSLTWLLLQLFSVSLTWLFLQHLSQCRWLGYFCSFSNSVVNITFTAFLTVSLTLLLQLFSQCRWLGYLYSFSNSVVDLTTFTAFLATFETCTFDIGYCPFFVQTATLSAQIKRQGYKLDKITLSRQFWITHEDHCQTIKTYRLRTGFFVEREVFHVWFSWYVISLIRDILIGRQTYR